MRLLVYDDDPVVRTLITEALLSLGHDVVSVGTEDELWASLKVSAPHALLIDYQLDRRSGLEVVADLRRTPAWKSLSVILLSASEDAPEEARRAGNLVDEFLRKPFEMDELMHALAGIRFE
ncbi:MAG: response regulator [Bdellovibrionota bacterium]|nr:MAG: response regulator [Bdellovibrionota bacterium]